MAWIAFGVGLFLGCIAGILAVGLLAMSREQQPSDARRGNHVDGM